MSAVGVSAAAGSSAASLGCRCADVRSRVARAPSDAAVAAGGGVMSSNQLFESWDGQQRVAPGPAPAPALRATAVDAAPGAKAIVAAAKGGAAGVINIHASSAAESSGRHGYNNVTVTPHTLDSNEAPPGLSAEPIPTCAGV